MSAVIYVVGGILALAAGLALYRAVLGPSILDRVLALDVVLAQQPLEEQDAQSVLVVPLAGESGVVDRQDEAVAGPGHRRAAQSHRPRQYRVHPGLHGRKVGAGVHQGTQQHVPGDARRRVNIGVQPGHSPGAAICAARCPAP